MSAGLATWLLLLCACSDNASNAVAPTDDSSAGTTSPSTGGTGTAGQMAVPGSAAGSSPTGSGAAGQSGAAGSDTAAGSGGDHITVSTDTTVLPQVAEVALNWMDLALYGTPEAADALTSANVCASCDAGMWTLKEKHLATLRR